MGGPFTWFNSVGTFMRILDRFLISENIIEEWKIVRQYVGNTDLSYHFHI